jgi:hypothetical protein
MYAQAKVSIKRYDVHACMKRRQHEDVNAPANSKTYGF